MIKTIVIKDNNFRVIGYIDINDNGDKTLKDSNYRVKGYYIASQNVTKDENFRIVGYGDVLSTLLNK